MVQQFKDLHVVCPNHEEKDKNGNVCKSVSFDVGYNKAIN